MKEKNKVQLQINSRFRFKSHLNLNWNRIWKSIEMKSQLKWNLNWNEISNEIHFNSTHVAQLSQSHAILMGAWTRSPIQQYILRGRYTKFALKVATLNRFQFSWYRWVCPDLTERTVKFRTISIKNDWENEGYVQLKQILLGKIYAYLLEILTV